MTDWDDLIHEHLTKMETKLEQVHHDLRLMGIFVTATTGMVLYLLVTVLVS